MSTGLNDSVTLDLRTKFPALSVSKKMKESLRRARAVTRAVTVGLFRHKSATPDSTTPDSMSDYHIDVIEQDFLKNCVSHYINTRTQAGIRSHSSPLPTSLKLKVDMARLTKNYSDAYTDTHGLFSGAPFVFKTGAAWPKPMEGPYAQPFLRELRPITNHPIQSAWDGILTEAQAYLDGIGNRFNAIMALGFANIGEETAFCPLVIILGVEPENIEYEVAKSVAQYVKINIITKAGFDNIEVAIWEITTSLSASARLPSLDPELDRVANFRHPFASTLGIPIAPLKQTRQEGTLGMFMIRGDNLIGITAAHVVCPSRLLSENTGLSEKSAESHHEDIIALGSGAYENAVKKIEAQIGCLQLDIKEEEKKIEGLGERLKRGMADTNELITKITNRIEVARQTVEIAKGTIEELDLLHSNVTKYMTIADNRCIGRILFVDPISGSSGPDGYTTDWAAIEMKEGSFEKDFQGNKIYIGNELDEATFLKCMFPKVTDRNDYKYPDQGLLQLRGVVSESELIDFKQLDVNGDPALTVVKNGRTSGTTIGSVSSLGSLARNYEQFGLSSLWSRELTIVPYHGARSPFSTYGDSGSIIADRSGRIVALLTGGGGVADNVDVTFATPYCHLEKRIKEALPGIRLLD